MDETNKKEEEEPKGLIETEETKAKQKKSPYDAAVSSFNEQINALVRTIRILEERYSNLRKKTQLTDQNMLDDVKKISTEIKIINSDIEEIRKQLLEVNEKISLLFEQIQNSVKKEDLALLDRYLNLWSPLRFVTFDEAKKIIEDNK